MNTNKKKLGIIQSRGLGDIVIALPIARYYHEQEWRVYWPICEEWVESMSQAAPWVTWVPVPVDIRGSYFYDVPNQRLQNLKCDEILCLYQALTGHDFHQTEYFQHTKFDQYKYIRAGVPFYHKWDLEQCITRDTDAERALYDRMLGADTDTPYVLTHLTGSDHQADFDRSIIPPDWRVINIEETAAPSIWHWLLLIERAECVVMVDSVFSNIVEQMDLQDDDSRYFIPRSHIGLTPVQMNHWTWIANTNLSTAAKTINIGPTRK